MVRYLSKKNIVIRRKDYLVGIDVDFSHKTLYGPGPHMVAAVQTDPPVGTLHFAKMGDLKFLGLEGLKFSSIKHDFMKTPEHLRVTIIIEANDGSGRDNGN